MGTFLSGQPRALWVEFFKMLLGSVVTFWIIAKLLSYLPHASPLYTLPLFGLLFSIQATYYKYKLSRDPNYRIPKCKCTRGDDQTGNVLQSEKSTLLGIPNSLFGVAFYSALLLMAYARHPGAEVYLGIAGLLASTYLAYVMIVKIEAVCSLCVNTVALNLLILWQFWLSSTGGLHYL